MKQKNKFLTQEEIKQLSDRTEHRLNEVKRMRELGFMAYQPRSNFRALLPSFLQGLRFLKKHPNMSPSVSEFRINSKSSKKQFLRKPKKMFFSYIPKSMFFFRYILPFPKKDLNLHIKGGYY